MTEYRAYTIGSDGRFAGCEHLVCANDAEAIEHAQRLAGDRNTIELWSGPRLVQCFDAGKSRNAVSHEIRDGCMVPKEKGSEP